MELGLSRDCWRKIRTYRASDVFRTKDLNSRNWELAIQSSPNLEEYCWVLGEWTEFLRAENSVALPDDKAWL
jgi:hypothetical protein